MKPVEQLFVSLRSHADDERPVGRLASVNRRVLFEFDPTFIADPLPISPAHLPVRTGVHEVEHRAFEGLFGVFHDSLPDGWGRLLVDREMDRVGVGRHTLGPLDRLAWVGDRGPGALTYRPAFAHIRPTVIDLLALAADVRSVLEGPAEAVFPELLALGGSSGGARPKVLLDLRPGDGEVRYGGDRPDEGFVPALVKFAAASDPPDIGATEQAYAVMARTAGVDMAHTWLVGASKNHAGFFATERFDRPRVHVHSLGGLLHVDHRIPALDYEATLRAVRWLTRDQRAVDQMFTRMAFNVVAHNRDDHSRNFAFLMDGAGSWRLAPAFDLTFSAGPGGEHWMTVAGEGRSPGDSQLLAVAARVGVEAGEARSRIDQARTVISRWSEYAREAGVSSATRNRIGKVLGAR